VFAYVEWFAENPGPTSQPVKDIDAITIGSLEAFNTSADLTPFALRSYRPYGAKYARVPARWS
jgi:hypothetical protein